MNANIEELETILLSKFSSDKEGFESHTEGLGFKVNGISFSLNLEQADSIIFFYVDSRCVIHYEGIEFLISNENARKIETKIKELKK